MELDRDQELEGIDIVNKVRTMVSELMGPFMMNLAEHDGIIKKLAKKCRNNKQKIKLLDNLVKRNEVKTVNVEDFNKKIEAMDKEFSQNLEQTRFDIGNAKIVVDSYSVIAADLQTSMKFMNEKYRSVVEMVDANYKYIREFRDTIALESSRSIIASKSFIDSQNEYNHSLSEKINKLSFSISELNSKCIPSINSELDRRNLEISEIKSSIILLNSDRVLSEDLAKLKNKLEGDIVKHSDKILKESEDLRFFLHQMLGLEISCGVSNTLLKVLDSKQLKKLIPLVESQLDEKMENQYSKDPLNFVSTDVLYTKVKTQKKDLRTNLASYKEKLTKEEERKLQEKNQKINERKQRLESIREGGRNIHQKLRKAHILNETTLSTEQLLIENEDLSLNSARSAELHFLQSQIDKLQNDLKIFESLKDELSQYKAETSKAFSGLQNLVYQYKTEFRTTQTILSEEVHHLLKLRTKETAELQKILESLKLNLSEIENNLKTTQENTETTDSTVQRLLECCKITQKLIKQDEEDRKSLQLTGMNIQPKSKSPLKPKQSVSLKPECISCTGQGSLLLSTFKLACLNYAPSDLQYNGKVYSRLGLISKIEKVMEKGFSAETSQANEKPSMADMTKRAKSATRVRFARNLFESTFSRGPLSETLSKKSDSRPLKFNF